MKIEFEEDRSNGYLIYFAISRMEIWKGKVHDELMWGELIPVSKSSNIQVIWEDDFYNPLTFNTLEGAKDYLIKNHSHHTPYINGKSYKI